MKTTTINAETITKVHLQSKYIMDEYKYSEADDTWVGIGVMRYPREHFSKDPAYFITEDNKVGLKDRVVVYLLSIESPITRIFPDYESAEKFHDKIINKMQYAIIFKEEDEKPSR